MHPPKIEFYKLRDFGAKMNATIEFLRENIKRLFINLTFIAVPVALLMGMLLTNLFSSFSSGMNYEDNAEIMNFAAILGGNYVLILLVSWLAGSMVVAVALTYIKLYNEGEVEELPVAEVLKLSLKKYGGILVISFLITILIFAGFMFFILPGFFLILVLPLCFATYVFEDVAPGRAIGRTFTLLKGKWWSTFGLGFVSYLLAYLVQMVFSIPYIVVYIVNIFTLVEEMNSDPNDPFAMFDFLSGGYMAVATTISMIGSYLSMSIPVIAYSYQYANLVERTEGRGLMNEIEDFDKV